MDVNVSDYNNDINLAIAALGNARGRVLITDSLTVPEAVTIPLDITVEGVGRGVVIKPSASMDCIFNLVGINSALKNLQIVNYNNYADKAIKISSSTPSEHLFSLISGIRFSGFNYGIYLRGVQSVRIEGNDGIGNIHQIYFANDGRNSVILDNHLEGGDGIEINKENIQCEGLTISTNRIFPSPIGNALGTGIIINGGMAIFISHNLIDNCERNGIILNGIQNVSYIKIIENWLGGNPTSINSNGILIYNPTNNVSIVGGVVCGFGGAGINILNIGGTPSSNIKIEDIDFLQNGIFDMVISYAVGVDILNNRFTHTSYSLLEADSTMKTYATGNHFNGALPMKSPISVYHHNWGNGMGI